MNWGNLAEDAATGGAASIFNGDLDSATGGIMGLIPGVQEGRQSQQDYVNAMNAIMQKLDANWQVPQYDQTPLTPQEYQLLSNYSPQIAAFVQQQQPSLLPDQAINRGTQAQNQSLDQLSQLSKSGTDPGMQAQLEEAQMSADQSLRSNRANALQALASRGLSNSGATLGADIATSLGAAEQQRQGALQAASDAANRKAQAINSLGNLGTQIAGQQQQAGEFNANTTNNYNQLLANRRQQYNNYVADTNNQATMYNQNQAQNIANMNTGTNNQFSMYNRGREDQNKTNTANFNNQKYQTEAGMSGNLANEQNQFGQQQAGNMTKFFMNAVGMGIAGATGGGSGLASYATGMNFMPSNGGGGSYGGAGMGGGDSVNYGNMNPGYSLGADTSGAAIGSAI